jgi:hypothetical protein
MLQLITSQERFDQQQLDAWRRGQREDIIRLAGSDHLRGVLKLKSSSRKKLTARFFGESYIASLNPGCSGFYGSFKWLTNARFGSPKEFPKGPARPFQHALRDALHKHFTPAGVLEVQRAALGLHRRHLAALDGKKPTAPDLWLIDDQKHHRFIEAKLPGDSLAAHQVAGLALLAACFGARHSVSVEVVELRPRYEELFETFRRSIAAAG